VLTFRVLLFFVNDCVVYCKNIFFCCKTLIITEMAIFALTAMGENGHESCGITREFNVRSLYFCTIVNNCGVGGDMCCKVQF